ncbi:hypothetical protein SAMN04488066_103192 [Halorubrum aquaticum]|uniref:Uncharacterized protein n=1 Tax=Halorubrum aquaticum TaxID=387340 RepID=A0A1I2ZWX4_9EURY|nr:hypothetical protein [Halorubrum aquaticum]SFH41989.1 hypothetical protein SAMN04488066_103192 [Halorubrum aquaticum]
MELERAVDRLEAIVDRVEREPMPVPVREVWAFGDVALGLDPIDRLDVYLTKDVLMESDADAAAAFEDEYGIKGVGTTVRASWAEANPDRVRASDNGYAAPEKCLAAELLAGMDADAAGDDGDDAPIHLEVCNASFGDNVTQRLKGALAREAYGEVLDPRGVCLWVDGRRDGEAFERLREASFAMPTLPAALSSLGVDDDVAGAVADALATERADQDGSSVRGDMV